MGGESAGQSTAGPVGNKGDETEEIASDLETPEQSSGSRRGGAVDGL